MADLIKVSDGLGFRPDGDFNIVSSNSSASASYLSFTTSQPLFTVQTRFTFAFHYSLPLQGQGPIAPSQIAVMTTPLLVIVTEYAVQHFEESFARLPIPPFLTEFEIVDAFRRQFVTYGPQLGNLHHDDGTVEPVYVH